MKRHDNSVAMSLAKDNDNTSSDDEISGVHGGEIGTSEDVSDYKPPYKVLWPGYYSGQSTDPRIGRVARFRQVLSERCGGCSFEYNEDDDVVDDEKKQDDESDDEYSVVEVIYKKEITICTVETLESFDNPDPNKGRDYERYWAKRLKESEENEPTSFKMRDCRCAEAAIRFYNDKHGTDYEIVETFGSYKGIVRGLWFHCNFRAQRKSESHSPKLFFAELYNDRGVRRAVNYCDTVNDRVLGCTICPHRLWHPSGFKYFEIREEEVSVSTA